MILHLVIIALTYVIYLKKNVSKTFTIYQLSEFLYSFWRVLVLFSPLYLRPCSGFSVTRPFRAVMLHCLTWTLGHYYTGVHFGCSAVVKSTDRPSSLFLFIVRSSWGRDVSSPGSGASLPGHMHCSLCNFYLLLLVLQFLLRRMGIITAYTLESYLGGSMYMLIYIKHLQ